MNSYQLGAFHIGLLASCQSQVLYTQVSYLGTLYIGLLARYSLMFTVASSGVSGILESKCTGIFYKIIFLRLICFKCKKNVLKHQTQAKAKYYQKVKQTKNPRSDKEIESKKKQLKRKTPFMSLLAKKLNLYLKDWKCNFI